MSRLKSHSNFVAQANVVNLNLLGGCKYKIYNMTTKFTT